MSKNGARHTPAVILSFGGHAEAFDIVRALGMEGIPSVVVSSQKLNIAFFSRHCIERVVVPDYTPLHYTGILDELKNISMKIGDKPVLFYVSDPELSFVSRFRDELEEYYRFLLPDGETLEHLFNKVLFGEFARRYQLPVPPTVTVQDMGALRSIASKLQFPCIVKPAYSQDWTWDTDEQRTKFGPYKKALRRFASSADLMRFCEALPERSSGLVIQSYIEGRDEAITSFHGYFDGKSRCLGYFVGRKIRTYPAHTGGSVYVQTVHLPELADRSILHLQRIRFRGIVKIDYKWASARHQFEMLEINPRYNLWELLGAYAGVNLAAIACHHQQHEPVVPRHEYRDDARLLFFKQDLRAFLSSYWNTKEWTLGSYLHSLMAKKYFRVYDPRDPLPFVVSIMRFFTRKVARLLGLKFLFELVWRPRRVGKEFEKPVSIPLTSLGVVDEGIHLPKISRKKKDSRKPQKV